ncbi:MAG: M20/M25/M40 family metallo-hydrolase [Pyrinomonadaceae bacterium]
MLRRRFAAVLVVVALLAPSAVFAKRAKVYIAPKEEIDKIKHVGMNESKVMNIVSYLTNVIGGRLTNSPNMKKANEWTRDTMASWGMKNAKLEAWGPFGRGWSLNEFSAQVTSPQALPVIAYPKAWSPSTNGKITGPVVVLDLKNEADFEKYRGKLNGAIVFTSKIRELKADFDGMGHRFTDKELLDMANAPDPSLLPPRQRVGFGPEQIEGIIKSRAFATQVLNFLKDEGAAVSVDNSSKGSGGTLFVSGASAGGEPPKTIEDLISGGRTSPYAVGSEAFMIPQMTMATENYNQIVRIVEAGKEVKMSVNIKTSYQEDDLMGYNTVAEIPGSDPALKDEVVMLGAHLDSWHASGGATDNAAGSAVVMEAARILISAGLKPRRTVRIGLWSGEEQGLNGSRAYVSQHFAETKGGGRFAALLGQKVETMLKPEHEKFSVYFNMDNGTGQFRGVYLQGNENVAPIFRAWMLPFSDMGMNTLTINNTGGTDHQSFDAVGLPGFQFIQDPIEYSPLTHHSNQDNYDRLLEADLKMNATVMAAFAYQAAMMDEKMPRK